MKIYKEEIRNFLYVFDYTFSMQNLEFCRYIKNTVGWQKFNFYNSKWRFNDLGVIELLKGRYNDLEISEDVAFELEQYKLAKRADAMLVQNAEAIKQKTDTDLVIKNITGELYPYQKLGVEFFINNNGRAILADTMGLGKTLQALAYIAHTGKKRTLIICPASVKYSWEAEVKKWTSLKSYIIDSSLKNKKTMDLLEDMNKYDVFIINYDIVKSYLALLRNTRWDCCICDEFHYIKNNSAQRTKAVKEITANIPSVILMSGTPLLSRPIELFNGLHIMDPHTWNNWFEYAKKYCQGHYGPFGLDTRGASNIEELQGRISRYFLRRKKEDVLTELPEKTHIDFPVELSAEKKFEYSLVEDSFVQYLKEIKNKKDDDIRRTMQAEKLVKLGELRQITSNGKIEAAKELISQIIDNDEKVVVFSNYNEPLEALEEAFGSSAVKLTGDTPVLMRKAAIEGFQSDPSIRVFLGGMKSAGVGITLTAGKNVIFIDYSWVPSDHLQAEDRIHRIGSKFDHITIYQLFAKDTIDEKMKEMLAGKQDIFNQVFGDGETEITKSLTNTLLKEYGK